MKRIVDSISYPVILSLMLFSLSCQVGKKYQRPEVPLPKQFGSVHTADTSSIADLEWKQFFSDPTLQQLLQTGIKHNNDLMAATKRIEIAQQQVRQSKMLWYPEIDALLSGQYSRPSNNSLNGISVKSFLKKSHIENYNGSIGLTWEIDIWGKINRQKEAALAGYLQTNEAAKAIQTRLVADIAQGYFNLLMLDRQLVIAKNNLALNDTLLRATTLLKNSGEVTALAVQQATAQRQQTAMLIPQIQRDIAIQQNALKLLTGQLPGKIERKDSSDKIRIDESLTTGLPAALLSRRPDVKAAEYALVIANANVGITRAQMYPGLNITAGGGIESFQFSNWFNIPNSLFGLAAGTIVQPVFNRRRLRTQYETARLEREEKVIQFKQAVLIAAGDVENALVDIENARQQRKIAAERVDTLEQAVNNAQLLFKSSLANYLEVITAQGNALQAELELSRIERDRLSAIVDLYRSLGGGWK